MRGNLREAGFSETPQQPHALAEALLKIQLTSHGGQGNFRDLVANAGDLRKLVNNFRLNQGGVHVKAGEARSALCGAGLQDEFDTLLLCQCQQRHARIVKLQVTFQLQANRATVCATGENIQPGNSPALLFHKRIYRLQR